MPKTAPLLTKPGTTSSTVPHIDEQAAVSLVEHLMSVPGKSGEENLIADLVKQLVIECGVNEESISIDDTPTRSPIGGKTGSVIVRLAGSKRGPRRMLMAHLDTVPLCVGSKPKREGDFFVSGNADTALGADDRSGVAVVLTALRELKRQSLPHPPLTLFWPVQEEIGLLGARHVRKSLLGNPQLCFNWDGGAAGDIVIGATGAFDIEIVIEGHASHAGVRPEAGVNAITVASVAIADLQAAGWLGLVVKGKQRGTSNIGIIQAGDATNVVTPVARLRAEARSHSPEFRKRILKEFDAAFKRAAKGVKSSDGKRATVQFSPVHKYESFKIADDTPCVQAAMRAAMAVGVSTRTVISNGGLDANWMTEHGFPTVTLGSGQNSVHTVRETLSIPDYLAACRIALALAGDL